MLVEPAAHRRPTTCVVQPDVALVEADDAQVIFRSAALSLSSTGWGDGGYGWLPYDYVLRGQAIDWWSLIQAEWVDTGQFA